MITYALVIDSKGEQSQQGTIKATLELRPVMEGTVNPTKDEVILFYHIADAFEKVLTDLSNSDSKNSLNLVRRPWTGSPSTPPGGN